MATYYVDGDNGNDGNDGLSEGQAKATIGAAVTATGAGDTVYVQNNGSTSYDEEVSWSTKHLNIIGYGSVVTDGVPFEMDGGSSLGKALDFDLAGDGPGLHRIENVFIHDFTDDAIEFSRSSGSGYQSLALHNAKLHNNGGCGLNVVSAPHHSLRATMCDIRGNASHGICVASPAIVAFSRIFDNGGSGIKGHSYNPCAAFFCEVARNAVNYDQVCVVVALTGDAADGTDNWYPEAAGQWSLRPPPLGIMAGFTRANAFGINPGAPGELMLIRCAFNQNVSGDINGTPAHNIDPVTGSDPLFVDPDNFDFRIGAGSPWKQLAAIVGLLGDAHYSYPDIGAMQINVTSGGVKTHPGTSGGARA